jgi:hypothetical protein
MGYGLRKRVLFEECCVRIRFDGPGYSVEVSGFEFWVLGFGLRVQGSMFWVRL